MSKKILSILLTLTILIGVIAVIPVSAKERDIAVTGAEVDVAETGAISQSDFNSRINSLRNDYPNGSYWGSSFDGGIQCFGFARLVAYNVFYSHVYDWEISYSMDGVKAGDVVQYGNTSGNGHTIFVLSVSGSTIKYVDCNGNGGYCIVRWDDSVTIGTKIFGLYSFSYRHVSPGVNPDPDPTPQGYVMSESEGAGRTIPDGDYWINSEMSQDYFLDLMGNELTMANGKNVQMWLWDNAVPSQYDVFHFEYLNNNYYKISQLNTKYCLDVNEASLNRGSNIQLWESNGTIAQQWSVEQTNHGYKLRSRCCNYYLDICGAKKENGTNIWTWEGYETKSQCFALIPYNPNERPISDGVYTIWSDLADNLFLDVMGIPGDYKNDTNVNVWYGGVDEKYRVEYVGNGYYRIFEYTSGLPVEVYNSADTFLHNGENIKLYSKNDSRGQLWKIRKNSYGSYFLISKMSGCYMDVDHGDLQNGSNVWQWQFNGGAANQRWRFRRLLTNDMLTVGNVTTTSSATSVTPTVTVKVDDKTLTKNTDYTVEVTSDIPNGTGIVTVTGKGNYCGTVKKTFTITVEQQPTNPPKPINFLGDVDGDEEVGVRDATYIQRYDTIPIAEETMLLCGDVNGDEEVGILDATYIQRYDAGFNTPYSIGEAIA